MATVSHLNSGGGRGGLPPPCSGRHCAVGIGRRRQGRSCRPEKADVTSGPFCHYIQSMRQERCCRAENHPYGSLCVVKAHLPYGVDHMAEGGAIRLPKTSTKP